ncbi:MAG: DUF4007 family protein [Halanaerobiales bacterium]|nr:DUF4007 family protein [Halanaerobiales bacterium]MCF8008218.1 DUF4007 family protein [Halanaerobiales bacterium]
MPYNINFHKTFKPERIYIKNLLSIDSRKATKEELSHEFSIPTGESSGKVIPSLRYAEAAGILKFKSVDNKLIIDRTLLGEIIYDNDFALEEYKTKLLFHFMFCKKNSKLVLWEALFRKFNKYWDKFYKDDFLKYARKNVDPNVNKKNIAPLWGTYLSNNMDNAFINIGLIKQDENGKIQFCKSDILKNYVNYYSFFLYIFLNEVDSSKDDFTFNEIIKEGFSSIFCWNNKDLRKFLLMSEDFNYININKQFNNYHIYKNNSIEDMIKNLKE